VSAFLWVRRCYPCWVLQGAVMAMAAVLAVVWLLSIFTLEHRDLGKAKNKPKFREIFSAGRAVSYLAAARLFLFASRDVWFVVALPVFLSTTLGWDFTQVGGFLACWIIGYGAVQTIAPRITGRNEGHVPDGKSAFLWAIALAGLPAFIALALTTAWPPSVVVVTGLLLFGAVFAVNSSLHSFLIVSYAKEDGSNT